MIPFRGLELHGKKFWSHAEIEKALKIATRYGLTALVLHESDFTTEFLYPKPLFDPDATWEGAPVRRGENALQNNQAYMRDILARAGRAGIEVWIENIELTFPDELLEKKPELMIEGKVCPSHPYWAEFIYSKYLDLARSYPGIRGVIASAGSPEGRAALSQKKCACSRCAQTELSTWYESLLAPMHKALSENAMGLAVREFSYTAKHQAAIAEAVSRLPSDIIMCVKTTPHDFYPTFPDNPLIAAKSRNPVWIEYDTMGQFYGWGAFPCLMRENIEARVGHAEAHNVAGAVLRVEWERVNDWWSLDTPNRMNLHAAASAARGASLTDLELLSDWLDEEEIAIPDADKIILAEFLAQTWNILKKALYVNDFVLNDSSRFPLTIARAWWSMRSKHSLGEWFPQRAADMDLDASKLSAYMDEKRQAESLLGAWSKKLSRLGEQARSIPFVANIDRFLAYVRGWRIVGDLCLLGEAMRAETIGVSRQDLALRLLAVIQEARVYASRLQAEHERRAERHQYAMLMDPARVERLADECASIIATR